MAYREIYKNGESKTVSGAQAKELVADQGWSYTKDQTAVKKTAKPKKAKVEVEAVELKPTGDDSKVIDLGKINEE